MNALLTPQISRIVALSMLVFPTVLLQADSALALEFRVGEDVVIAADEMIDDDLYLLGKTVTINGTVNGDVMANGRKVVLNGEVGGDLTGCGQTFIVDGKVGDDLRMAGMNLKLGPESRIGDDVLATGLSLKSDKGNVSGGSLLFAGYKAQLAGRVGENIHVEAADTEIAGQVIREGEVEKLQLPWARVRGLPAPLVVGLLLCWLAPGWLEQLQQRIGSKPIKTTVIGGLAFIVLAIFAVFTLVFTGFVAAAAGYINWWSFAGLVAGFGMLIEALLSALLVSVAVILAPVLVAMALGRWLLTLRTPILAQKTVSSFTAGFAVLGLLWIIPYAGFITTIIVLLLGLGALAISALEPLRAAKSDALTG